MKNLFMKAIFLTAVFVFSPFSYAEKSDSTDASIVSSINSAFASDKSISDLKVKVSSHNGVVTLKGKVNTDTEADKLIQTASSTPGVTDVKTSSLTVKESKHSMADTAITAKVKGMYVREKLFGDKDISVMGVSVETTNGVVYLTGTVNTQAEADNAVKYAKSVSGVKKVESKLEVKPAG